MQNDQFRTNITTRLRPQLNPLNTKKHRGYTSELKKYELSVPLFLPFWRNDAEKPWMIIPRARKHPRNPDDPMGVRGLTDQLFLTAYFAFGDGSTSAPY